MMVKTKNQNSFLKTNYHKSGKTLSIMSDRACVKFLKRDVMVIMLLSLVQHILLLLQELLLWKPSSSGAVLVAFCTSVLQAVVNFRVHPYTQI